MRPVSDPLPPGVLPDLLHQTAFNLCAVLAYSWGGPARLVSGNPFYVAELAWRLEGSPRKGRKNSPPVLVWADPRMADLPEVADLLERFPPGSAVLILFARRTRAFVPGMPGTSCNTQPVSPAAQDASGAVDGAVHGERARRLGESGVRPTLRLREILDWLAEQGFCEEARYGIGGSAYRSWSRLAYLVERLGQADHADRFRARARAALLVESRRTVTSVLTLVLTARRDR